MPPFLIQSLSLPLSLLMSSFLHDPMKERKGRENFPNSQMKTEEPMDTASKYRPQSSPGLLQSQPPSPVEPPPCLIHGHFSPPYSSCENHEAEQEECGPLRPE
jgi:hypothetical protein